MSFPAPAYFWLPLLPPPHCLLLYPSGLYFLFSSSLFRTPFSLISRVLFSLLQSSTDICFKRIMPAMFEVYWEIGHPSSWELSEQVLVL